MHCNKFSRALALESAAESVFQFNRLFYQTNKGPDQHFRKYCSLSSHTWHLQGKANASRSLGACHCLNWEILCSWAYRLSCSVIQRKQEAFVSAGGVSTYLVKRGWDNCNQNARMQTVASDLAYSYSLPRTKTHFTSYTWFGSDHLWSEVITVLP